MAASDSAASAASALRRFAAEGEDFCKLAFSQLGRRHQRTLKRACIHTETPPASGHEGGSGLAGASTTSTSFRLDPADNSTNQVTASDGANINNLDVVSVTNPLIWTAASPTASLGTQDPIWRPSTGGLTSLDAYLMSTNLVTPPRLWATTEGAGGTMSSTPPTARPGSTPTAASRAQSPNHKQRPLRARCKSASLAGRPGCFGTAPRAWHSASPWAS